MKPYDTVRAAVKHAAPGQVRCPHYQAVQAVPPQAAEQQPLAYPLMYSALQNYLFSAHTRINPHLMELLQRLQG